MDTLESLRRALAEAETLKRISDSQAHEAWIERDGALARLAEAEKERVTTVKALHVACKAGRASEEALRAAEERAAQAERALGGAKAEIIWAHSVMRRVARTQGPDWVTIGTHTLGLKPGQARLAEIDAVLGRAEPRAAAPEALSVSGGGAQGEEK